VVSDCAKEAAFVRNIYGSGFRSVEASKPSGFAGCAFGRHATTEIDVEVNPNASDSVFAQMVAGLRATNTPYRQISGVGDSAYGATLPNGGILVTKVGASVVYINAIGTDDQRRSLAKDVIG
jgi:hypothetical protein